MSHSFGCASTSSLDMLIGRSSKRQLFLGAALLGICFYSYRLLGAWSSSTATFQKQGSGNYHNLFVFGDSLSSTNFHTELDMPTSENPFGTKYPGLTSSGGPNWLGFLFHDYMPETLVFNFAQGGSLVNASEFNDLEPGSFDFSTQVDKFDLKTGQPGALPVWDPAHTLFVAWLGTNDVYGAFLRELNADIFDEILFAYFEQLTRLVELGAETFLVMTPEPIQYTRLHDYGRPMNKRLQQAIYEWSAKLRKTALRWQARSGKIVHLVDVATIVERALKDKVAGSCSVQEDNNDRGNCMWQDKFHLGIPAHRLIAAEINAVL